MKTRTRTPLEYTRRFDTPPIYNACIAPNCSNAGRYDRLCYIHTCESRRKLASELRRLQRHHGALTKTAHTLIDTLLTTNLDLPVARAVTQLQRHLPPTPEEQ